MRLEDGRPTTATQGLLIASAVAVGAIILAAAGTWPIGTTGTPPVDGHSPGGPLSLYFEANEGQTDPQVQFLTRGSGYALYLTSTGAVLSLPPSAVRLGFPGARPDPEIQGLDPLPGRSNYLIGNNRESWSTDVPHFGRVHYSELYAGIDLVFYGNQGQLEYDFIVSPGADPNAIRLSFEGPDRLSLEAAGNLALALPSPPGEPSATADETRAHGDEVVLRAPVVYQELDGARRPVDGSFALLDADQVGFVVGDYDPRLPLVIDPVLVFSTFFGGDSEERGAGIAVDDEGNIYVTGHTWAADFPTKNAFQPGFGGGACSFPDCANAFVAKLNASGRSLIYSTYLGASGNAFARAIAVDAAGNAYVTGNTNASDFPTINALQGAITTGGSGYDAFVTQLDPTGSSLVYSTYLGGSAHENAVAIDVDRAGTVAIVGTTASSAFPTANAYQGTIGVDDSDAFVTWITSLGTSFIFSTFLGGSGIDEAEAVAIGTDGRVYVTGQTLSSDFPTANAFLGTKPASTSISDAFVLKLQPGGTTAVYSTYLGGGNGSSGGYGIDVDGAGNVYVGGSTGADDFPTLNALQGALVNESDIFITKMNPAGSALIFSTYFGGYGSEGAHGLAVDKWGKVHITGITTSADIPTVDPVDPSDGIIRDAIVAQLSASGTALLHSSHLSGSNGREYGRGIAVDSEGSAYIVGETASTDFPTKNAFMGSSPGNTETAFIIKLAWPMNFWLAAAELADDRNSVGEERNEH